MKHIKFYLISEKRSRYDQYGTADCDGAGGLDGGFDFSEYWWLWRYIWRLSLGEGSLLEIQNGPKKGADLEYNLNLTFEEAVFGVEKEVSITRNEKCEIVVVVVLKLVLLQKLVINVVEHGQIKVQRNTPFGSFVSMSTCDKCGGKWSR